MFCSFILNLFIFGHAGSSRAQALLQLCPSGDPWSGAGRVSWGAPSCGRAGRVLPSCGARASQVLPLVGRGFSGCFCGWGLSGCALLWAGAGGVLPSCGRGFSVAALLWAGFFSVLPSCGSGASRGCCPLAGRSWWGRRLQLFPRDPHRCGFRSVERRLSIWDAEA